MGFSSKSVGQEYKTVYQTQPDKKQRNKTKTARLVDVISINPASDGGGSMYVSEKGSDNEVRYFNVQIEPERLLAARKKSEEAKQKGEVNASNYSGAFIDDRLLAEFKRIYQGDLKGAQAVLEQTDWQNSPKTERDGHDCYNIYTTWVRIVTQFASAKFKHPKAIRGIITADGDFRNNRARTIQLINPNCVDASNEEAVENKIRKKLDVVMENFYDEFNRGPSIGVRFLICEPTLTPEDKVKIVETTLYYDWIRAENENEKGHPLDRKSFDSVLSELRDYVNKKYSSEYVIQIMYYTNYLASNQSKSLTYKPDKYSPMKALVTTPYLIDKNDNESFIGKFHASLGVLLFSGDKYSPKDSREIRKDFVNHVAFDSISGNVLKFIKSSDKKKFDVPNYLSAQKNNLQNDDTTDKQPVATIETPTPVDKSQEAKAEVKETQVEAQNQVQPEQEKAKVEEDIPLPSDDFDDDIPF